MKGWRTANPISAAAPVEGLAQTPYWTSTDTLFAETPPQHLVIIGSSVVAVELAQAFRRLGSEVTMLARHTLLYREDPLLGGGLCTSQRHIYTAGDCSDMPELVYVAAAAGTRGGRGDPGRGTGGPQPHDC